MCAGTGFSGCLECGGRGVGGGNMGPLSTQRVTPLPSPHVWQGHSQGPPCLPAGGAASVSPSPLHPAPLAPARREAIDPAPAAAIVLVSGASAAPSPAWPREDHPSQARPIEVTVGGGLSCTPTCTQREETWSGHFSEGRCGPSCCQLGRRRGWGSRGAGG